MRRVNEIFYSLQGEGHHTGRASVFVRFSGCNLRCPFCDTDHFSGVEMSDDEIIDEVCRYPADWVVLTGGEPSLQIDAAFVGRLKSETGKSVAIETNGTRPLPDNLDWTTLSPKIGIAGAPPAVPGESFSVTGGFAAVVIDHADEIKVVDLGQDLEPYFALPCRSEHTLMYLQPCCVDDPVEFRANIARTIARVEADPRWRLSTQTHKFLNIR